MGEFHYLAQHEYESQHKQEAYHDCHDLKQQRAGDGLVQKHACPSVSEQEVDQVAEGEHSVQSAVLRDITCRVHRTCVDIGIGTQSHECEDSLDDKNQRRANCDCPKELL